MTLLRDYEKIGDARHFAEAVEVLRDIPPLARSIFAEHDVTGEARDSSGKWTKGAAQPIVDKLAKETGTKFAIVGSVARKGSSIHDLDILDPNERPDTGPQRPPVDKKLKQALGNMGFEYTGQSLMSPEDVAKAVKGKTFPKGKWSELHHFENKNGRKLEVWGVIANKPDRFAEFDPSEHPRGQPDNKGQFAPKDGGSTGGDKSETVPPRFMPALKGPQFDWEKGGVKKEQVDAIDAYVSEGGYDVMNNFLRGKGGGCDDPCKKQVETLQGMIDKAPILEKPLEVARAVRLDREGGAEILRQFQEAAKTGGTVTTNGFSSTSTDPVVPLHFGATGDMLLTINARKGIGVAHYSREGENEFLMGDKSKFKVSGGEQEKMFSGAKMYHFYLEQVLDEPAKPAKVDQNSWIEHGKKEWFDAIASYTGYGFDRINGALRHGRDADNPRTKAQIAAIREAFANAPEWSEPKTVYRAIQPVTVKRLLPQFQEAAKNGGTVKISGFSSSSLREQVARDFGGENDQSAMLVIKAHKGLGLDKVTVNEDAEDEVLLNDGESYKVVKKPGRNLGAGRSWRIELEQQ